MISNFNYTGYFKDIALGLKNITDKLEDISRKLGDDEESDTYVRDHLLIQWMYEHKQWLDGASPIEDIYKCWMNDLGGRV